MIAPPINLNVLFFFLIKKLWQNHMLTPLFLNLTSIHIKGHVYNVRIRMSSESVADFCADVSNGSSVMDVALTGASLLRDESDLEALTGASLATEGKSLLTGSDWGKSSY